MLSRDPASGFGLLALSGDLQISRRAGQVGHVRPITRANVDTVMKESTAVPPTLPTCAARRMDPMPSAIVQKEPG